MENAQESSEEMPGDSALVTPENNYCFSGSELKPVKSAKGDSLTAGDSGRHVQVVQLGENIVTSMVTDIVHTSTLEQGQVSPLYFYMVCVCVCNVCG